MATKKELQQQLISLGGEPGEKTVAELKAAIKEIETADTSTASTAKVEKVELNATQKRQEAAKKLRAERKKQLEAEAKKAADKKADTTAAPSTKEAKEKDTRKVFTDDRGLKFRFKKSAPKALNIDGASVKTSEIIENEEIMLELVHGNSNFIEQIY